MHMFFCISLSFNLCVVVRVGSIGSWLALISVMMGTSIYCVVVPTRGRSISLLVMVRFGGMHIDLIYWPLFGRVGQLNLTWKKCTYSHFRMEKIHIGISWKNQYIFIQKIAKIGTTELAKFFHSLSETELTRHCQKVWPNRIFGRSLVYESKDIVLDKSFNLK